MNKTVLITGGARGIGRATSLLAARDGWQVCVNFINDAKAADEVVSQIRDAGGEAITARGDVSCEEDVLSIFDQAQKLSAPLMALVNNAGIVAPASSLSSMSIERLRNVFDVNILGAFLCAREAARRLPDGGCIVNVSSLASRFGSPGEYVDYAAAKGAVDVLTLGLSKELGPKNIRVNAVRPGVVETDIHASSGDPNRYECIGKTAPLGRHGKPKEIAEAIVWLMSDKASYTTGALLDVSGGR